VIVTAPLAVRLVQRGMWHLRTPLADVVPLPPALRDAWRGVTLWHLLTHTSGLPAWVPPPLLALEAEPGARVRYSDVGYWLLGWALERVSGRGLDELARDELFRPCLFATAVELARFAQALLEGGGGVLSPAAVRALLAPQTVGLNERRGLGWCLYDPRRPPAGAGDLWTERAFGHTGFTGVSLWADPAPERRLIVVLLTTWVGGGAGRPAAPR